MKEHTTYSLAKGIENETDETLVSAANFQELQSPEEHADLHHEYAISKIQAVSNSTAYVPFYYRRVAGGLEI